MRYKIQYPLLKRIFAITLLISIATQLNWALTFNFDDIHIRIALSVLISIVFTALVGLILMYKRQFKKFLLEIEIKPPVFFSLIFFSIYFYLSSQFYYTGVKSSLGFFSILFLLPSQFIGFLYSVRLAIKTKKYFHYYVLSILLLIAIFQLFALFAYIDSNDFLIEFLNTSILIGSGSSSDFVMPGLIFLLVTLIYYIAYNKTDFENKRETSFLVFFLSLIYIIGLIFYWSPITVYSSSPESFGFAAIDILKANFLLFIFSILGGVIVFYLLPVKFRYILIIVFLTLTVISFIYSSIIPIELGTLQLHRFSDIKNIAKTEVYFILESLFILGIFVSVLKVFRKAYFSWIITILTILNISMISQSLILNIRADSFFTNPIVSETKVEFKTQKYSNNDKTSNNENQGFISFSSDKENVVVIILDMLQGWYLEQMLNDNPELKQTFSGFKWYPNTISITNYTSSSAPSLFAGFDFTPEKLNEDSLHTLKEKIVKAKSIIEEKALGKSYNFISSALPYSRNNDRTIPIWSNNWDNVKQVLNIGSSSELAFSLLWQNAVFYCLPLMIKPVIYNNGDWMFPKREENENTELTKHYNFLRVLPYISNTNSDKASFIYFWTYASHFPWDIINDKGDFIANVTPYQNNLWTIEKIASWMKWMKKNKVYDNSKIIILSDHGIRDTEINDTVMITNPFIPKLSEKVPLEDLLYFTPLMMVKDYNQNGQLEEDWRFLSNADTYSIAFDENDPTKAEPPIERTLEAYRVSWENKPKNKKIPIEKIYKVKRNIYEIKNWERISVPD